MKCMTREKSTRHSQPRWSDGLGFGAVLQIGPWAVFLRGLSLRKFWPQDFNVLSACGVVMSHHGQEGGKNMSTEAGTRETPGLARVQADVLLLS